MSSPNFENVNTVRHVNCTVYLGVGQIFHKYGRFSVYGKRVSKTKSHSRIILREMSGVHNGSEAPTLR